MPKGQKLNKGAPSNITVFEKIDGDWKEISKIKLNEIFSFAEDLPYSIPVRTQRENTPVKIKASVYHCNKVKNNYCVIDDFEGEIKRTAKAPEKNLTLKLKGSSPSIEYFAQAKVRIVR